MSVFSQGVALVYAYVRRGRRYNKQHQVQHDADCMGKHTGDVCLPLDLHCQGAAVEHLLLAQLLPAHRHRATGDQNALPPRPDQCLQLLNNGPQTAQSQALIHTSGHNCRPNLQSHTKGCIEFTTAADHPCQARMAYVLNEPAISISSA